MKTIRVSHVAVFAVVAAMVGCQLNEPAATSVRVPGSFVVAGSVDRAAGASAVAQPGKVLAIAVTGSESAQVTTVVEDVRRRLSAQPRVREVRERIGRTSDERFWVEISYEFRGPQKLADRVHASIISETAVPRGNRVSVSSSH